MGIIINGQNDTIGPVDNTMSLLGTVSIGGTMTIEDFTNIDSVGLITARNGLHVTSGNVAIGHNNPLNTLHVKGPTGGVSARFTDAVNATVFVSHPSSGKSKIADAGGNYGFEFDTASVNILSGGSERLRITSAGNVGINETTPEAKLELDGRFRILDNSDGTPSTGKGLEISYYTSDDKADILSYDRGASAYKDLMIRGNSIDLKRNNTSLLKVGTGGGNGTVGFSTTAVLVTNAEKIAVRGYSSFKSMNPAYAAIYVSSEGNTNDTINNLINFNAGGANRGGIGYMPNTGELRFNNQYFMTFCTGSSILNGTERLRITSDGKIGIGVGSPTQMMEITNTGGTGTQIQMRDTSTGNGSSNGFRVGYNGDGGQLWNFESTYIRFATGNAERVRIDSTGKFGIGTASPTAKLHVQSSSDTGEIRLGGGNGAGEHRLFFQAHPSTAYIDSYGNNTHNPLSINADPLILNYSGSGKVLIKTNTNNDNQAWLVVDGMTDCGKIVTGRIKDSTNNSNRTVLLHRMNQGNGFQFSGDIITNSWTGNAKVNCHITVRYNDQAVEVDVVNATHSSQISKTNLRVVTADYGSNRYLGIQKNGGGTGVFYINALVSSNIDTAGNGGIREVNNTSLGSVTTHGNLN